MARKKATGGQGAANDRATKQLQKLRKRMVDFTVRLLSVPTVNPPGRAYKECCELLAGKLQGLGMTTHIYRVPQAVQEKVLPGSADYPRYNVVGRWDVGARRTLHFTGHTDVVPPTSGWKTDPFKPVIKGNRLYARGANDMKGSNAAAIFAVQAMMAAGITPPWNIEFSFTADEETGGELGLGWLVKSGKIRPDAAVLLEGAGGATVGYAHKGVLWLEVTVIGKPSHACVPGHGVNALEMACKLIEEFRPLQDAYRKRRTAFRMGSEAYKHPTLVVGGVVGGGGKVNTVPDRFRFSIDRRINPEETAPAAKAEIMAVIRRAQRKHRRLKVSVRQLLNVPPAWIDPDHEFCKLAQSACQAVFGKKPKLRMTPGFTDMHWLSIDAKVPTVLYGCGGGGGAHADQEHTVIPAMLKGARVLIEIATRLPRS